MMNCAQDKATALMQIASIGNGDAFQFALGKQFAIQVTEEKLTNLYQFKVLGQETINTKSGDITTWHIVRPARPGAYSSQLDIWLAPQYNWIPAQIRNIETNGTITTQTLREIISGSHL